ncbi:MAG: hypothetical protein WC054_15195, partial [Candidatus Nanopelagicales bacterium]
SRVALGVLVGTAAVALLAGCGSSTATSEPQPQPTDKEAGVFTKDIKLTVTNNGNHNMWLTTKRNGVAASYETLGNNGQSSTTKGDQPSVVIERPRVGPSDTFTAYNPVLIGSASIRYRDGEKELNPGQSFRWTSPTTSQTYEFSRAADAGSYVYLTITIVK